MRAYENHIGMVLTDTSGAIVESGCDSFGGCKWWDAGLLALSISAMYAFEFLLAGTAFSRAE